ncbi:hypothetical protein SELMODRAFT_446206 [Selaginella moellendorffii]|uniref:Equilibrative nucleoside transporter n=1 Tax=Selaginella moellendorffii TaxID=88036 RepID=D8SPK2_SELML|nr:equilibrative nucleotide transporter 1 [Selaginella moellendorffii]EFJ13795.1 hypothetical protein SELMODRAFT_446206 [Selaginella moellendorffii]|eukprot:XP_002985301.1 equilibrative nucleotide transporter 1 [Selaginella moellendorffii]
MESDEEKLDFQDEKEPRDHFKLAYISFFILGAGFLLPWNAFITAVDYFDFLYPGTHIDRVFSIFYMFPALLLLLYLTFKAGAIEPRIRINLGLVLFLLMMLIVPIMDESVSKPSSATHYITIAATGVTGLADALVQGSLVGSAGELPERYMQALVAGTAASGVLVSCLRVVTKAALPSTPDGLRSSANVYFITSVIFMVICLVSYNLVTTLPVIRYHLKKNSTKVARQEEVSDSLLLPDSTPHRRVSFHRVWSQNKGLLLSLALVYLITLSIFPGSLTEDVHSAALGDWFPVLIIACYNVCDLLGKSITAVYLIEDPKAIIGGCIARLIFFPVFFVCLHGPRILGTEVPVFLVSALLGITNGYYTSAIMIKAPKLVPVEESETTGILLVVFLVAGLSLGSIVGWVWVL